MDALLEVLLPSSCVACDDVLPGPGFFCADCAALVEETPTVACARCAEPGRFDGGLCPHCRAAPRDFARAWAPFEHSGSVARAIHRFKYEDHPELARPLGGLLAQRAQRVLAEMPGALCPVPLHVTRFQERRYDQASLLAVALARATGRPLQDTWLERTKATARQVGLSDQARAANVEGAFRATAEVQGQDVVLVDDVFTTGATARAAARALTQAGARTVSVVTLARATRELG